MLSYCWELILISNSRGWVDFHKMCWMLWDWNNWCKGEMFPINVPKPSVLKQISPLSPAVSTKNIQKNFFLFFFYFFRYTDWFCWAESYCQRSSCSWNYVLCCSLFKGSSTLQMSWWQQPDQIYCPALTLTGHNCFSLFCSFHTASISVWTLRLGSFIQPHLIL